MRGTKIHVVPCVVVFNKEGKVLLLKRARSKRNGGKWEIPGGSLKYGESPRKGAIRELMEETGIRLNPLFIIPVDTFGFLYPEMGVEFIIPLYSVKVGEFEPRIRGEEHDGWGWFTIDEIKEMELRDESMKGAYIMVLAAKKVMDKLGGNVRSSEYDGLPSEEPSA
ncbi:NUDIX hydrolase [Candidatus Korarchaeum cryptofilum]|uniref:NUDIX hydrolase n=2 Tax=Candidatus Korarchaeum cryptofilum TaxID=498846 RepID=B1L618_KORCO|nr:NUDIX hydrolase [Candidatus Korarchaeum cryptofilum]ACB07897.1 NUDIX hydrolase [Candidatus Korarchaeum cryptofilum OPF8]RSN69548.1 NUDIX hydrolase [Candidatus Korarchaeum cryptofilum]